MRKSPIQRYKIIAPAEEMCEVVLRVSQDRKEACRSMFAGWIQVQLDLTAHCMVQARARDSSRAVDNVLRLSVLQAALIGF